MQRVRDVRATVSTATVHALAAAIVLAAHGMAEVPDAIMSPNRATTGEWGNSFSMTPSLSFDGGRVAFYSPSSNLVAEDENGAGDIFLADLPSGGIRRIPAFDGRPGQYSDEPGLSGDGNHLVYRSFRDDLVPEDDNQQKDVFWMDLATGETRRVTAQLMAEPRLPCSAYCGQPSINHDGSVVAFDSWYGGFADGDSNEMADVFVYDAIDGAIEWISRSLLGGPSDGPSWLPTQPAISGNGRFVVFSSKASNLVEENIPSCGGGGAAAPCTQVYVFDRVLQKVQLVSATSDHRGGNGESAMPAISAAGNRIVFASQATDLVPTNGDRTWAVVARDWPTGQLHLVSKTKDGSPAQGDSFAPAISGDGSFVAFVSSAEGLATTTRSDHQAAYLRNMVSNLTIPVFTTSAGALPDGPAGGDLRVSGDGSVIAGSVRDDGLVAHDANGAGDVFVRFVNHERDWAVDGDGREGADPPGRNLGNGLIVIVALALASAFVAMERPRYARR